MIKSFKHKGLAQFDATGNAKRLPVPNAPRVRRILDTLRAATNIHECDVPGYKLHPLGEMAPGRWSIWANARFRITFKWTADGAEDVDIEQYHDR